MRSFLIRRLIGLVFVLVGVSLVTFILSHVLPADPARVALGGKAGSEQYEAMREQMGLDRPLYVQYAVYVGSLLHGDLGYSYTTKRPVRDDLLDYFPASLELMSVALILAATIAIPLGVLSAARPARPVDRVATLLTVFGAAMPLFLLGLLFQVVFYKQLGWLPATGRIDVELGEPTRITGIFTLDSLLAGDWPRLANSLKHLILPAVTLAMPATAILLQMVRTSMIDSLGRDYVRTARSKGIAERQVIYGHALRNALLPTLTSFGLLIGALLSGAFLVEVVYTFPGLGMYVLNAILRSEFSAIVSTTLLVAAVYVIANVLVDIAYALVDPRIRYA
jgi:peptide/nickel transport system permease protein